MISFLFISCSTIGGSKKVAQKIKTIVDNITGESKRVQSNVALTTSHGLKINDNIINDVLTKIKEIGKVREEMIYG